MKIFLSKAALTIYVGLAILLATAFGFGDTACGIATSLDFQSDLCVEEAVEPEAGE